MGWFHPVVPHPVVVWEVVVNQDCEMWSHRDGFPVTRYSLPGDKRLPTQPSTHIRQSVRM